MFMRARTCSKPALSRWTALLFCVLFAASFLVPASYVIARAGHDHDDDGPHHECTVCLCLAAIEKLIKRVVTAAFSSLTAIFVLLALGVLYQAFTHIILFTPVALKVRLNN